MQGTPSRQPLSEAPPSHDRGAQDGQRLDFLQALEEACRQGLTLWPVFSLCFTAAHQVSASDRSACGTLRFLHEAPTYYWSVLSSPSSSNGRHVAQRASLYVKQGYPPGLCLHLAPAQATSLINRTQGSKSCELLCRGCCDLDWTALKGVLQKSRSADTTAEGPAQPHQLRVRSGPSRQTPGLPCKAASHPHDSASSSIESRYPSAPEAPEAPEAPKLHTLGRLGTAGSMPVYSYRKATPLPSCPVSTHTPRLPSLFGPIDFCYISATFAE